VAEVELKFDIAPGDLERLRSSRALGGVRPRTQHLLALYLDTPDEQLAAHGMALRLRREGRQWVQTLKAGGAITGGLHARDEWESPSADGSLDLARWRETPLAELPDARTLHQRLAVLFQVDVERTTWLVRPARGVQLEVALDVGRVRHGASSDAVCEVEIESKSGPESAVFELADQVLDDVALVPSAVTKAQRGYRLARAATLVPVHARPADLAPAMNPAQGAAAVLGAALAQLLANAEGVARSDDPEFVHQLRVALRRARSGLRTFRPVLGKARERELREALRWITSIAGRARDLDVFAMQTLPAMAKATATPLDDPGLARRLHAARQRARMELVEAIAAPRFARAVLGMGRLARAPSARDSHERLDRFCASRLAKAERAVRREADGFAALDAAARHRLRIRAKRLRYALDACGGLFGAKRVKRYTSVLSEMQDALGDANDARIAATLVAELRAGRTWRSAAGPWLEAMETEAIRRAAPCVERLRSLVPPWRKH
jgi:inorganic triphosphatase YgiF